FMEAIEHYEPDGWAAYVQDVCCGDDDLRQRVEKLLHAHRELGEFSEPASAATSSADIVGEMIGDYRLVTKVGEGGMGAVYLAEQTHPVERRVALKIIKPGMDTRKVIARFQVERQALARMDHPNIARVLDAGQTDGGRPYFIMEFVDGVSVTEYCERHQLSLRQRLELFLAVCQAVQHAHQKGIIHRDIKPSNVLVTDIDGRAVPKVIDFGVSKAVGDRLADRTVTTEVGQIIGTPEYMSPEQASLSPLDIDTRSDVYSLGVLAYELITGETPFDRRRLRSMAFDDLLRTIREEEPLRPSLRLSMSKRSSSIATGRTGDPKQLSSRVGGELDWIVMKAIEKDPSRRYETASKFADDVRHYLNDESVSACPPSRVYRLRKFARRHKTFVWTASVILLALIVGLSVATSQALRAMRAETLAEQRLQSEMTARQDAEMQRSRATTAEKLARDRLWTSLRSQASMLLQQGVPGQRFETLAVIRQAIDAKGGTSQLTAEERLGLRNDAIAALARFDIAEDWRHDHPQSAASVETTTFSADFEFYAVHDGPAIVIHRTTDHEVVARVPTESYPVVCRFSPDSAILAVVSEGPQGDQLELWKWRTAARQWILGRDELGAPVCRYSVSFHPQRPQLALGLHDNSVVVASLEDASIISQWVVPAPVHATAYSPTGKYLAVTASDANQAIINDVAESEPVATLRFDDSTYAVAWSQDGRQLAVGLDFGAATFRTFGPEDIAELVEQAPRMLGGHAAPVHDIQFRPDGNVAVTWGYDGKTRLWDMRRGTLLMSADGHADRFDPRGDRLSFRGSRTFGVWRLAGDDCLWQITSADGHQLSTIQLAWLADGAVLAVDGHDAIYFFDVPSRRFMGRYRVAEITDMIAGHGANELLVCDQGRLLAIRPQLVRNEQSWELGEIHTVGVELPDGHRADYVATGRGDSGTVVAVCSVDRPEIILLDDEFQLQHILSTPSNVESLWVDPRGRYLASGLRHEPPLYLFALSSCQQIATVGHDGTSTIAYHPRAGVLVSGSWLGYRAWDVNTWQLKYELARQTTRQPCSLEVDPDGRWVVAADSGASLIRFRIDTGEVTARLRSFHPDATVWNLCLDPMAKNLAAGCLHYGVQVWDLKRLEAELTQLGLEWDD
ncbi:MAG: protein kinase, partial [Planctomycetales bacterium]|nr:protein kinase [Planctomycetales bacterium]